MSKFLNISTDTTLGGNSASDDTVSSQKAVKAYVDSQTGTAPAFANITGQPTDNANLATALAGKVPTSRTINSKALTSDITLTASDVGALPDSTVIPTVNNATLTIQKNGTTVNTFTANASSNVTANITVPTKTSDLTNDDGFITGITSSDVTTALGYTPYNSSNPAGYTSNVGTVTSVNNVSPVSGNVTLSIPTVNDATLTITQGGTTKGTFTANASSNVTIDLDSGGGSSRNIGEIVQSTIPLTDAGLHLLDGALIQGSGSYADFVTYIASIVNNTPDIFTTEANWQTSITNYGACDKYVYDSVNNTVRIPKRTTEHGALIKSYSSGTKWYRIYSDGWCEQGGNALTDRTVYLNIPFANTNYNVKVTTTYPTQAGAASYAPIVSVKQVNSFYCGNYNGQQSDWQACGYTDISDYQYSPTYEYIVIATSTKTQIEVDIDEVMTDLNGKADVDLGNINPSATAKANIVSWGMPDYSAGISVSQGVFTPTVSGLLIIIGNNAINAGTTVYLGSDSNGIRLSYISIYNNQGGNTLKLSLNKGETYYISSTLSSCNFYPFKGELNA